MFPASRKKPAPLSLPLKVVYGVLALVCMILGVVGILVPVIPGVVFLAAGIFLLSKVSMRVRAWRDHNPTMKGINARLVGLKAVEPVERAKVGGLLVLNVMAGGIVAAARLVRWLIRWPLKMLAVKP